MHSLDSPDANSINADFAMPMVYKDFLTDALDTGQADNILTTLREIRKAMLDAPAQKACEFDLNLNDVLKILKERKISPILDS